jgi:hypothetical protein
LGTIFLRNFYTALDFDNNLIIIGLNKGAQKIPKKGAAAKSYIQGKVQNPFYRPPEMHGLSLIIIMIVIVCLLVFLYLITGRRPKGENEPAPPKDDNKEN